MKPYNKGPRREPYSPDGTMYTMDDMFDEFAKWRMCAIIYKKEDQFHCDILRPAFMADPYTGQQLPATEYWGWSTGSTRFEAVQTAVKRLHKIINECREDGINDNDI